MRRRKLVLATGGLVTGSIAGCTEIGNNDENRSDSDERGEIGPEEVAKLGMQAFAEGDLEQYNRHHLESEDELSERDHLTIENATRMDSTETIHDVIDENAEEWETRASDAREHLISEENFDNVAFVHINMISHDEHSEGLVATVNKEGEWKVYEWGGVWGLLSFLTPDEGQSYQYDILSEYEEGTSVVAWYSGHEGSEELFRGHQVSAQPELRGADGQLLRHEGTPYFTIGFSGDKDQFREIIRENSDFSSEDPATIEYYLIPPDETFSEEMKRYGYANVSESSAEELLSDDWDGIMVVLSESVRDLEMLHFSMRY